MEEHVRRKRSFTVELLLWIVLLVVVPIMALFAYFYIHTFAGLKQVEEEKSILANHAAQMSIETLGETISGVTITNGYWEANRQAVLTHDIAWLNKNIGDMTDVVPNVNFVAETDLQGNILVQAGDVKEFTGKLQYGILLERFKQEKAFSGILQTSKGVAVVAVSQVTGDQGESEAVGLLITGRFLDDDIMKELGHRLQTDIALLTQTGQYITSSEQISEETLQLQLGRGQADQEQFSMERIREHYLVKVDAPFKDMAGQSIGIIHTQVESVSTAQAVDGLGTIGLISLGILVLLLVLVIYLLRHRIILPLRHFTASLEEVAAGRSVEAIPKHVLHAEAEIVIAIQKIMQWNQVLEHTVEQRTAAIRSLLDNANQGFLSIGPDLKVKDEYSVECTRMFTKDIAGMLLAELLCPGDSSEDEVLTSILSEYFAETDEIKRELMLSLLPDEVTIMDRTLLVEVKPFAPSGDTGLVASLMFMLTDVTDKRRLELQMQEEQNRLKMMVQAVVHADDYADIARDFERFHHTEAAETIAGEDSPEGKALALYRAVHTFKGSFGFLRIDGMVSRLHDLESDLQELLGRPDGFTTDQLATCISSIRMDTWLKDEEAVLKGMLGDAFEGLGQRQSVKIAIKQWRELERWVEAKASTDEDYRLLAEINAWRYKPIQTLLKQYPPYLQELAERKGLLLHAVQLHGGDVQVDTERYYGFAKSLVHVVRNIAIHGIESEEERLAAGKDGRGSVSIEVSRQGGQLRIVIRDDGRGIDLAALRLKASRQGDRLGQTNMTDDEVLQLIFREQFSTAKKVSEWAGRGIGLSAVKEEVDRLGGEIQVTTVAGAGTSFVFLLPDQGNEGENTLGKQH